MKHVVLGAGGAGGLIAAALARSGGAVTLVVRPESLPSFPASLTVESAVLGSFQVPVRATARLDHAPEVLWVTVKNTQLADAIAQAPPEIAGDALVVPLLNGIDHVSRLREAYGPARVVPGVLRTESERQAPGVIRQSGSTLSVDLCAGPTQTGAERVAEALTRAGISCTVHADEATVLWKKLVGFGPTALATSAMPGTVGEVLATPRWRRLLEASVREACSVAVAAGASVNADAIVAYLGTMRYDFRTSMQKDVEAGRAPEIDAVGGAILRWGRAHHVPTPATQELVDAVASRAAPGQA